MDIYKFFYAENEIEIIMKWIRNNNNSIDFNIIMTKPFNKHIGVVNWIDNNGNSLYKYKTAREIAENRTISFIKKYGLEQI